MFTALLLVTAVASGWGQVTGDYRSLATGNWDAIGTWEAYDGAAWAAATVKPASSTNVYIQSGHTVTLTGNETCNDLNIAKGNASSNNTMGVIAMGSNTLSVSGKLRSYWAAVNTIPGTASTTINNSLTSTSGVGKLVFVGNTRTICTTGEWGNNPVGWDVEFAPNAGQILTIATGFKARNITVSSGTLLTSNGAMRPDGGADGSGTFLVKSGSALEVSSTSSALQRTGTAGSYFGSFTLESGAILTYSGILASAPVISAAATSLSGTVKFSAAGNQVLITKSTGGASVATPDTYNNLMLGGSGVKTLGLNTTVNGTLTMGGTATLALSTFTLTYGGSSSLAYEGNATQATGAECLATIPNLTINNSNGVTLSGATTVSGALTFANGKLDISAFNLTIGSASGYDAAKYIVESGVGMLKMNTLAAGSVTYPLGTSTSYVPFVSTNNTSVDVLGVNIKSTITNSTNDNTKCVQLEWLGNEGTPGGNDGTITFQWNTTDHGTSFNPAQPVFFGVWSGAKYDVTPVTVNGSNPYTVTIPVPDTYPTAPVIFGNAGAFPSAAPVLTVDATNNDVDNNIELTFTDDAAWRAAITAVKVGATALTATTDYTIAAGVITLIPSGGNAALTLAGSKDITIEATGYAGATATQVITAGVPTVAKSTISNTPAIMGIGTTTVTITAKDQFENLVSGYVFKYDAAITNGDATNTESYTIAGVATTASIADVVLTATNASGVATFDIIVPATVDPTDGISIQVQLNDGTTNLGAALSYIMPAGPSISAIAALSETTLNAATIEVSVSSETFVDGILDKTNFTLNNAPAGVTISDVAYISATSATVTLAYDGTDFDANVTNLTITVAASELTSGGVLISNNLTVTALVETSPVVTTNAAITTNGFTTATWGGNVSTDGGEAVTEKGICWSTVANPTIADSKTTESAGIGAIVGDMTSLTVGTKYYVRAYATNVVGTNYGTEYSFTTQTPIPAFTATYPQSANVGNNKFDVVVNTDAAGKVYFLKMASGAVAPTSATVKSTGTAISVVAPATSYSATITGLTASTTYDVYFVTENITGDLLMASPVLLSVATTVQTYTPIHDIQYTTDASGNSPLAGTAVTISGTVMAVKSSSSTGAQQGFYVQDGPGAWNGVYVYSSTFTVSRGDNVIISGTPKEYNGLTEIDPVTNVTVVSQGNTLPASVEITTQTACTEAYESVLVTVKNVNVVSGSAGSFVVNDGSGDLTAYKSLFAAFDLTVASHYDLTGLMTWFSTASLYELYPRDASDVVLVTGINNNDAVATKAYPNPFTGDFKINAGKVVRNVTVSNMLGQKVMENTYNEENVTVVASDLKAGIYLVNIKFEDGTSSSLRMVKK